MSFHVMYMKLPFQLHGLPVYDLSSENYWTVRPVTGKSTDLGENLLSWEKIYWPGNNEVYFYLTTHFITKHKQYSLQ